MGVPYTPLEDMSEWDLKHFCNVAKRRLKKAKGNRRKKYLKGRIEKAELLLKKYELIRIIKPKPKVEMGGDLSWMGTNTWNATVVVRPSISGILVDTLIV